jgi:hypothetical protein
MEDEVKYLFSLEAVRERANIVYDAAKEGRLSNFDFHPDRMQDATDYVVSIIEVNC